VTRGDAAGLDEEEQSNIFVAENCVLVHHGECHQKAHTRNGQRACVLNLLQFLNWEDILEWLSGMKKYIPGSMFNKALDLVRRAEIIRSNQ